MHPEGVPQVPCLQGSMNYSWLITQSLFALQFVPVLPWVAQQCLVDQLDYIRLGRHAKLSKKVHPA